MKVIDFGTNRKLLCDFALANNTSLTVTEIILQQGTLVNYCE